MKQRSTHWAPVWTLSSGDHVDINDDGHWLIVLGTSKLERSSLETTIVFQGDNPSVTLDDDTIVTVRYYSADKVG